METLIDATQVKELVTLIKATATDEAAFLQLMVSSATTLEDIRQRDFPRLLMALREKKQRRAQK
jgi:hypothetical protein